MTDTVRREHLVHSVDSVSNSRPVPGTIHVWVTKSFMSAVLWMIWESSMMLEMGSVFWDTPYDRYLYVAAPTLHALLAEQA